MPPNGPVRALPQCAAALALQAPWRTWLHRAVPTGPVQVPQPPWDWRALARKDGQVLPLRLQLEGGGEASATLTVRKAAP